MKSLLFCLSHLQRRSYYSSQNTQYFEVAFIVDGKMFPALLCFLLHVTEKGRQKIGKGYRVIYIGLYLQSPITHILTASRIHILSKSNHGSGLDFWIPGRVSWNNVSACPSTVGVMRVASQPRQPR